MKPHQAIIQQKNANPANYQAINPSNQTNRPYVLTQTYSNAIPNAIKSFYNFNAKKIKYMGVLVLSAISIGLAAGPATANPDEMPQSSDSVIVSQKANTSLNTAIGSYNKHMEKVSGYKPIKKSNVTQIDASIIKQLSKSDNRYNVVKRTVGKVLTSLTQDITKYNFYLIDPKGDGHEVLQAWKGNRIEKSVKIDRQDIVGYIKDAIKQEVANQEFYEQNNSLFEELINQYNAAVKSPSQASFQTIKEVKEKLGELETKVRTYATNNPDGPHIPTLAEKIKTKVKSAKRNITKTAYKIANDYTKQARKYKKEGNFTKANEAINKALFYNSIIQNRGNRVISIEGKILKVKDEIAKVKEENDSIDSAVVSSEFNKAQALFKAKNFEEAKETIDNVLAVASDNDTYAELNKQISQNLQAQIARTEEWINKKLQEKKVKEVYDFITKHNYDNPLKYKLGESLAVNNYGIAKSNFEAGKLKAASKHALIAQGYDPKNNDNNELIKKINETRSKNNTSKLDKIVKKQTAKFNDVVDSFESENLILATNSNIQLQNRLKDRIQKYGSNADLDKLLEKSKQFDKNVLYPLIEEFEETESTSLLSMIGSGSKSTLGWLISPIYDHTRGEWGLGGWKNHTISSATALATEVAVTLAAIYGGEWLDQYTRWKHDKDANTPHANDGDFDPGVTNEDETPGGSSDDKDGKQDWP